MGLYCGFDVQAMLNFMSENDTKIELECIGFRKWRLYGLSDKHGEFDNEGTLFSVVMQAFQPFLQEAKADRERFHQKFNSILE
ncbi:hypothetical protein GCM10007169_01520 [Shewanella fodinae]|nr:hypothetical protein GCM10007169_01520 [Shewanella fodinae]